MEHREFNYIDIMNIKAISRRGTPLWKIMRYWDAYNRGYPTYLEFKNSINKLVQIGAIQITKTDGKITLENNLFQEMTYVERITNLIQAKDELILKTLNRLTTKFDNQLFEITEKDFENGISEYRSNNK